MKKILLISLASLLSFLSFAQKPNFGLVGFGVGTVGGAGGTVVTVSNYDDFTTNVTGTDKKIIYINGTITAPGGGVILDIGSNKSIIGVGNTAFLKMINLHLKNSQQVIIQNIKMSMIGSTLGGDADMISIETTSANEAKYIWIDHCEFFNTYPTLPETASKKDLYDGMIDIKKSSSLITISWNYFHDHWKCSLIGYTASDVYDRKITYHHNHFKNIKSRAPSYRGGTAHIYNNFFDGLNDPLAPTSDAANSREGACLKVESNYFKNYKNTIYCAIDDVVTEGFAYGSNNLFENSTEQKAALCSSFTPPYNVTLDKAKDVLGIVTSWSGVGKLDAVAYKLTTSIIGNGSIILNPAGGVYPIGTSVILTPVADANNVFASWSGGLTGNKTLETVVMSGNKTVTATFSISTGFENEATSNSTFRSFPTPVLNEVQLDFEIADASAISLTIKDDTGRIVLEPKLENAEIGSHSIQLDMSALPSGIYHCMLQDGQKLQRRTLVKQ